MVPLKAGASVRFNQAEFRSNVWHGGTPEQDRALPSPPSADNVSPDNPAFHVLRRCPEF